MPSPFPGMNPYLEDPRLWRGVHDRLIPLIAKAINDVLPDGYFADINERVYISEPRSAILPDVAVLKTHQMHGTGNQTAVLDCPVAADVPLYIVLGDEVREPFVEIMTVADQDEVVTAVEVVSPANKMPGIGWEQYTAKQQRILNSRTNLLEIDLLRAGMATYAPLAESLQSEAVYDYLVSLHRAGTGLAFEAWLFTIRDRLPRVSVPLSSDDADIVLDLQGVFERCYDDGPYGRRVNYEYEPIPPVREVDGAWLDNLLRRESLRQ